MSSLIAFWRRNPWLGLLAALSVLLLMAYPVYLSLRVYIPVLSGVQPGVMDFSHFYDAAVRFSANPLDLYPDPYGYMYPPPSIVLFWPLALVSLPVAFSFGIVAIALQAVAAVWLALRLVERWRGARLADPVRVSLLLIGLASAPVFQNMKWGQVNVFVLLTGLGFLWLLDRDRPFSAALLLSLGFWFKLYPLALALLVLRRKHIVGATAGFAVGLGAVPLVLLPLVPAELYRQYVIELMPFWTSVTNTDALNQSITGVLTHMRLPLETYTVAYDVPVSTATKALNSAVGLVLLAGIYGAYFFGRLSRIPAGFLLLATLPVVSVLGWEHTYVLALPLFLLVLAVARTRMQRLVAGVLMAGLLVPKPPVPAMLWMFEAVPRAVVDVFFARFLIATLIALAVGVGWLWMSRTKNAPAAEAAEAHEA